MIKKKRRINFKGKKNKLIHNMIFFLIIFEGEKNYKKMDN